MKITIEDDSKKISIEKHEDPLTLSVVIEDMFVPALLAIGFHQDSINKYFCGE